MKTNWFKIIFLFVAIGMIGYSCDELNLDSVEDLNEETLAQDAKAEGADGDVFAIMNSYAGTSGKATTTFPNSSWNGLTLTVDYGTEGVVDPELNDGIKRKGKVIFALSGLFRTISTTLTVTFDNYSFDGNVLNGTRTYARTADNTITEAFTNNTLTFAEGGTMTWSSAGTVVIISEAPFQFKINRTVTGTNAEGVDFTRTAVDLIKLKGCKWFDSGNITTTEGDNITSITFKTGECGKITVTFNGLQVDYDLNEM